MQKRRLILNVKQKKNIPNIKQSFDERPRKSLSSDKSSNYKSNRDKSKVFKPKIHLLKKNI